MYILVNKEDKSIVAHGQEIIVDRYTQVWIAGANTYWSTSIVAVVGVENIPEGAKYYNNNKFYSGPPEQDREARKKLQELDNARDAETLFDILKAKGVLSDEDLPKQMLERFNQKKELRHHLNSL